MTAYATRTIHLLDGKITNGAQEPQAQ